jgi:NitT/TauT family transport system substrate-binding protein
MAMCIRCSANAVQAAVNAMVRTLKWMAAAKPDEIVAKLPAKFYQHNAPVYRRALLNNLASFTPDGLMPRHAPENVLKAMAKFDPKIAEAKIDMAATYDNKFVEKALQIVK